MCVRGKAGAASSPASSTATAIVVLTSLILVASAVVFFLSPPAPPADGKGAPEPVELAIGVAGPEGWLDALRGWAKLACLRLRPLEPRCDLRSPASMKKAAKQSLEMGKEAVQHTAARAAEETIGRTAETMTSENDLVEYNHENELNARALAEADANDLNACLVEADAEAEAAIAAADEEIAAGVIKIDDDEAKPTGRKPMASRSPAWEHFTKVFNSKGVLIEGLCKHILIKCWMASTDPLQVAMGKRMKEKFDKYWGSWHEKEKENDDTRVIINERGKGKKDEKEKENINLLIFVAAVLDPRYKLSDYTKISTEEIYGLEMGEKVWAAINLCVRELFEEYRMQSVSPAAETPSTNLSQTEGGGCMMKQLIANRLRQQSNSANGSSKSELDKYLAEDCEDPETQLDILAWWKVNASRFPTLAKMARAILAIPISTVASESSFSTSGRILDDFRTSLTPFMVQALVCTQDWLRRSTDPVDIKENLEELEVLEKELLEELDEQKKGKRKAAAASSLATAKSSKHNNT